jgi:hypothetical protein
MAPTTFSLRYTMVARRTTSYSRLSKSEVAIAPVLVDKAYDGLLSPEERARLLEEVEDDIHEEEVERATLKFKADARTAIRVQKGLEEEQVTVLIDLPGHSDRIRIDNRLYYHAFTYTVPYSVAETLFHIMDRAWRHEEETGGANKDAYRRPRNTGLSATKGVSNAPTSAPQAPAGALSAMSAGRVAPKITTTKNIGSTQL